jgi:hypothetical protein
VRCVSRDPAAYIVRRDCLKFCAPTDLHLTCSRSPSDRLWASGAPSGAPHCLGWGSHRSLTLTASHRAGVVCSDAAWPGSRRRIVAPGQVSVFSAVLCELCVKPRAKRAADRTVSAALLPVVSHGEHGERRRAQRTAKHAAPRPPLARSAESGVVCAQHASESDEAAWRPTPCAPYT